MYIVYGVNAVDVYTVRTVLIYYIMLNLLLRPTGGKFGLEIIFKLKL